MNLPDTKTLYQARKKFQTFYLDTYEAQGALDNNEPEKLVKYRVQLKLAINSLNAILTEFGFDTKKSEKVAVKGVKEKYKDAKTVIPSFYGVMFATFTMIIFYDALEHTPGEPTDAIVEEEILDLQRFYFFLIEAEYLIGKMLDGKNLNVYCGGRK